MARMMLHSYGVSELIRDAEVMREDAPKNHVSYTRFKSANQQITLSKATRCGWTKMVFFVINQIDVCYMFNA